MGGDIPKIACGLLSSVASFFSRCLHSFSVGRIKFMSSDQTLMLADPRVEAIVAEALINTAYQCPGCYFKDREALSELDKPWPARMRWEADVFRPCATCGASTHWCVGGPFKDVERKKGDM